LGEEEPTTRSTLLASVAGQFSKQMLHVVWPTRFLGRAEMDDRLRELAHVYRQLSQAHYLNNEFLPCYQAGLHYVNLTEMLNESPMAMAEAYANTGLGFGSTQMQPLAERYGRKARRLSRQVDSKHTKAYVLLRQGMYYTGLARWQEAQTSLEEAATLSQSINDWRMLADSWHTLGYASIYQGDFGYAHEMGRREYELALRQGNRQQQMWGLHLQAVFYLHLDRVNKAVNLWEQARALYQEGEGSVSEIAATAALGIGYLHQGHYFQAEEIAARVAEQLARSRPFVTFLFDAYTVVPTIYLKLCQDSPEERPRWQPLLQQGVRALGRFARAFPVGRPRYRWLEGELAQMQGKEQKALQAWQKCLAEALRLQMPYDEGLAHLAYGRTLPETDPNQAEHLKQAETIFHQLNALIDLAQVRALQTGK
jgi:tetratricopeptide (TPR) repeat protein